ncbi:reverse transcriptase/maturase family protein [Schaedlerella arabinosiphila]|uniref:reverse transcriptase/maturase family protein n=1 Tax=Schaedlerella arabinosiphila TaxID=2044587 RepID=UPI002557FF11|nr:reverse transcriptase/maturase family protein [Schaedlerella arabinosiphila]
MKTQKEYNQCQQPISCHNCSSNQICQAWVDFVKHHNDTKPYAHFGLRVSLSMPSIRKYVMDRTKIVTHSFYPFIHFEKKNSRYGKKGPKKPRELYYCSHLDRCVYQRYAFLLNYQYNIWACENNIDDVAIAYRDNLGKNNIDFAKDAFDAIRSFPQCFILVGDFTNFFDNLEHQYLKKMMCEVLGVERLPQDYFSVFKNITRFSSWDWKDIVKVAGENIAERGVRKKINSKETVLTKEQFQKNKKDIKKNISGVGVPQGSPISAVLSNIYMIKFDKDIKRYVTSKGGIYMRYSDDFIIVLPYERDAEIADFTSYIFSYVESMKGLIDLQKEKTSCYTYKDEVIYEGDQPSSINYLGFLFDGKNIRIRPRAITKYYYRMRRKAHTIGRSNWTSSKGRRISAKELYSIYSRNDEKQTFIDYARKAKGILKLNDQEANALIKHHKRKIAMAIKEGQKK